jgi:hypothetical protein
VTMRWTWLVREPMPAMAGILLSADTQGSHPGSYCYCVVAANRSRDLHLNLLASSSPAVRPGTMRKGAFS